MPETTTTYAVRRGLNHAKRLAREESGVSGKCWVEREDWTSRPLVFEPDLTATEVYRVP